MRRGKRVKGKEENANVDFGLLGELVLKPWI
jgi:hypothetical protein